MMTERATSIPTQIATPVQGASRSSVSAPSDAIPARESVDEEPYTIKCICDFSDDDGNTIYCDNCDTWQHIECYYPGRVEDASKEEFDHACADCKPRSLDSRNATERQRHHRQNKPFSSPEDKKSKRPPSKSHKKKVKPSEVQVNGFHEHERQKNGSPHDVHPTTTKKPKGHRASQSVSSKRSPPLNPRPHNHAHPPSPAHTPPDLPSNVQVHSYSDNFISLYDDDPQLPSSKTNSFASLAVTNAMSSWLRDPAKLLAEVGFANQRDVIQTLTVSLDSLNWPELQVEQHQAKFNDTVLQWRSLVNKTDLHEPGRIGEVNGIVGYQKDYCNDVTNRWSEYIHPRPFIFFPSRLPLFIDARKEGSICRYVRRSCRPNSCLETFVIHGSEYHFWLVSDRPLSANEQVTIPWEFVFPPNTRFLKLLNLGDGEDPSRYPTDITDEEYNQLASTVDLVLSDYGGCACGLGNECAFARFHRNYHRRAQSQSNGVKSKKGRKPKQNHVSPTSTGHATNSRAASEGQDPYDEDDSRSQSGSIRSKPHSRDLTPLHGVGESNGIFTEPSDREKRKLAMLEDSFRKMEQQQQPIRKKAKRASDTSTANLPHGTAPAKGRKGSAAPRGSISQPSAPNIAGPKSRYVDASTSGRQSGSPFSAISPPDAANSPNNHVSPSHRNTNGTQEASVVARGVYVSTATQTDPMADAWWDSKPKPKRSIVPLAKRLMNNRHKIQSRIESQGGIARQASEEQQSLEAPLAIPMDLEAPNAEERNSMEPPTDSKVRQGSISSMPPADVPVDVTMVDAPSITMGNPLKPPPPTWRVTSAIPSGQRPVDLRVQMPPAPTFTTPNMGGLPSGSVTPAASAPAQSPFGTVTFPPNVYPQMLNGTTPSPAKATKKLSLSEYKSRMKTSAANKPSSGSSPTVPPAALKLSSQDVKASGVLDGSAVLESPLSTPDKTADPLAVAGADTKLY